METNCVKRSLSTGATQSLLLLNGEFLAAQAGVLEEKVRAEVVKRGPEAFGESAGFFEEDNRPKLGLAWSYGYGRPSDTKGVKSFTPLPYWLHEAQLQGGPKRPDSVVGWCQMSTNGATPQITSPWFGVGRHRARDGSP